MINTRTLLLLAIALVLAFASVLIAQQWVTGLQPPPPPPASQVVETIPVVVASQQIQHLSKVRDLDVKIIHFPKDTFPMDPSIPGGGFNYFKDTAEVVGKIVTQTVYPGEPLARQRVRDQQTGGLLANYLDAGEHMRAISVRINDVTGVSGFILPMDRVDVMLIHKRPGLEAVLSDLVVQDVKVLAMDQSVSPDEAKPFLAKTATLEVKPSDATRILKAAETGTLQLMLRNPRDRYPLNALIPARDPAGIAAPSPPSGEPPRSGSTRLIVAGSQQQHYLCTTTGCIITAGFTAQIGGRDSLDPLAVAPQGTTTENEEGQAENSPRSGQSMPGGRPATGE